MSSTKKQRETDTEEKREMPQGLVEQTGYCRFVDRPGLCVQCRVGAKSG